MPTLAEKQINDLVDKIMNDEKAQKQVKAYQKQLNQQLLQSFSNDKPFVQLPIKKAKNVLLCGFKPYIYNNKVLRQSRYCTKLHAHINNPCPLNWRLFWPENYTGNLFTIDLLHHTSNLDYALLNPNSWLIDWNDCAGSSDYLALINYLLAQTGYRYRVALINNQFNKKTAQKLFERTLDSYCKNDGENKVCLDYATKLTPEEYDQFVLANTLLIYDSEFQGGKLNYYYAFHVDDLGMSMMLNYGLDSLRHPDPLKIQNRFMGHLINVDPTVLHKFKYAQHHQESTLLSPSSSGSHYDQQDIYEQSLISFHVKFNDKGLLELERTGSDFPDFSSKILEKYTNYLNHVLSKHTLFNETKEFDIQSSLKIYYSKKENAYCACFNDEDRIYLNKCEIQLANGSITNEPIKLPQINKKKTDYTPVMPMSKNLSTLFTEIDPTCTNYKPLTEGNRFFLLFGSTKLKHLLVFGDNKNAE